MKKMSMYMLAAVMLAAGLLYTGGDISYASDGISMAGMPDEIFIDNIYIAGAPDAWPFEYYDKKSGGYEGVIPELLERIREEQGISVRYVEASPADNRLSLASNTQVDAVFSMGLSDREMNRAGLWKGAVICRYLEDGEEKEVCIAYTKSIREEDKKELNEALSARSQEEIQGLLLVQAEEIKGAGKLPVAALAAVSAMGVGMLSAFLLTRRKTLGKKQWFAEYFFQDEVTGRDNLAAWKEKYKARIVDENKQNYAVLYMYTGMDVVSHINGYEEAFQAMKLMGDTCVTFVDEESEGFARINEFCFVFFIQYTGIESIKDRIRRMHDEIKKQMEQAKKKYFPELYTGIYRLKNIDMEYFKAIQLSEVAVEYARMHSLEFALHDEYVEREVISGYMMEHEAVHGLINREFIIYLQPVVDLATGKICGAESLVRWQNPSRGLLKPGDFLKALKRKQLIGKVNMEVYRQGCYFLNMQMKMGNRLKLIFNFTVENVGDERFVEHLEAVAKQFDVSRDQIIIQLNQVVEMSQSKLYIDTIKKLRNYGFDVFLAGLELDGVFFDYLGSGINGMKLRHELISRTGREEGQKVVSSVVKLCHELKLKIFCVGVENREQAEWLENIGCEMASGFYYHYPVSPEVFHEVLAKEGAAATESQGVKRLLERKEALEAEAGLGGQGEKEGLNEDLNTDDWVWFDLEEKTTKEESLKEETLKQETLKQETLKQESQKEESLKQEPLKQELLKEEPLKEEPHKEEVVCGGDNSMIITADETQNPVNEARKSLPCFIRRTSLIRHKAPKNRVSQLSERDFQMRPGGTNYEKKICGKKKMPFVCRVMKAIFDKD